MTGNALQVRVPWTFWGFAGCSLIWNLLGAADYVMTEAAGPSGGGMVSPALAAAIAAMPWWQVSLWAIGIWASLAGSALLLARRRIAGAAFAVSFAGAAGSYLARAVRGPHTSVIEVVVFVGLVVVQWGYAWRSARLGRLG